MSRDKFKTQNYINLCYCLLCILKINQNLYLDDSSSAKSHKVQNCKEE